MVGMLGVSFRYIYNIIHIYIYISDIDSFGNQILEKGCGILTFLIAPAAIVYMNLTGWWE